jgi:hypothetical protein
MDNRRYLFRTLTDPDCAGRTPNHVLRSSHTAMPAAGKVFAYIIKRRKYAGLPSVERQMNRFTECREARQ